MTITDLNEVQCELTSLQTKATNSLFSIAIESYRSRSDLTFLIPIGARKVETLYLDAIHKNTAPALVNTAAETKARLQLKKS